MAAGSAEDDPEYWDRSEVLVRRGNLTASFAGAAMETSLSVDEAERTPRALAARERLEVTAERGRVLYPLREGDAPLCWFGIPARSRPVFGGMGRCLGGAS